MSMKNWSTTAASNATVDSIGFAEGQAPSTLNDSARALMADVRYELATQDTIASATTTDLGSKDAGSLTVSGTTTITSFGTVSAGIRKLLTFSGALTLTHNGTSLILPGAANITTVAGDSCIAESLGSGNWKVHSFQRISNVPAVYGTGVATALAVNVGSAGAPVVNGGALGTPSSGVATNLTGTAAGLTAGTASAVAVGGITGLGTGVATALAINVGSAGAPVTFNGALGTPSSGTVTNLTGTASININGTVGATTPTTGAFTTVSASGNAGVKGGGTTTAMLEVGGTMAAISSAAKEVHILNATNPILLMGKDGTDYAYMQQVTGTPSYFQMGYRAIGDQIKFIDTGLTTIGGASAYGLDVAGTLKPTTDNTVSCGSGSFRWSVIYAGTGTINTSDAREKTAVAPMTSAEIEASKQLAREIGTYKWLSAVAEKGDAARKHVGFTVQRAIEIMQANGLDPMAYGFICYDQWDDKFVDHPAIEAKDAVLDEDGNVIEAAIEAKAAWTEQTQHAGDRYAFRYDELNMFIARGFEARLSALEAANV